MEIIYVDDKMSEEWIEAARGHGNFIDNYIYYLKMCVFYHIESVKDTLRDYEYLLDYINFIYLHLFEGKMVLYIWLGLLILWFHILGWLTSDATTFAVIYFNNKHSTFFLKNLYYITAALVVKGFYSKKRGKLRLYKSSLNWLL